MGKYHKIADTISYFLSPVSIAFYVILILTFFLIQIKNTSNFIITLFTALFFLCITPAIGILIYTKKGVIDIWVSDQKTRTPFYIIAIIGYIIGLIIFYWINQHEFFVLTLAHICVTFVLTLTNLKTKMSSHAAGLTGPLTAVVYLFGIPAFSLFLLLPLLIWARLELNAHSMAQLIGGSIIGVIVTYSTYLFFH